MDFGVHARLLRFSNRASSAPPFHHGKASCHRRAAPRRLDYAQFPARVSHDVALPCCVSISPFGGLPATLDSRTATSRAQRTALRTSARLATSATAVAVSERRHAEARGPMGGRTGHQAAPAGPVCSRASWLASGRRRNRSARGGAARQSPASTGGQHSAVPRSAIESWLRQALNRRRASPDRLLGSRMASTREEDHLGASAQAAPKCGALTAPGRPATAKPTTVTYSHHGHTAGDHHGRTAEPRPSSSSNCRRGHHPDGEKVSMATAIH